MDDDTLSFNHMSSFSDPPIASATMPASSFDRFSFFLVLVGCLLCYCYFCHRIEQNGSGWYPNVNGNGAGLDENTINSYPKLKYKKDGMGDNDKNDTLCSVCLCEYEESEMLRMMPECRHYFHVYCLDKWLTLNGSCPVCRNRPVQQS
ncbi:hypothetical protein L6164_021169 [Bauhinia variegata]|uniref:Uncharacterized protein n=1 Tax=Bauhinia variegata TaxID=167791 RepID=A0ACB9N123_BAUVA|nr:hypothetical protein L6164_021169 [Bauhinia variegata]